jgi:predicted branched-subunit amino acid permease
MAAIAMPTTRVSHLRAGALAMAPLVVGYAPFALVIGAAVARVEPPVAGWSGSWLIYGGSAHLAALQGIAGGETLVAIATALLVHARLLVYSASMAPQWADQPRWFRLLGPALLIDPTWALVQQHPQGSPEARRGFFLGAGLLLGAVWSTLIAVGAIAGSRLPSVGLEMAAPLCLIALLGSRLRDRAHRWAAVAGAGTAVVGLAWPYGMGIAAAIVAGTVAAHLAGSES